MCDLANANDDIQGIILFCKKIVANMATAFAVRKVSQCEVGFQVTDRKDPCNFLQ